MNFLPSDKRKKSIFDFENVIPANFSRFRRFNHRSHYRLMLLLFSICSLLFAVRIGSILFVTLTDFMDKDLAYSLEKIKLPYAQTTYKVENKRLLSYVSVEENGKYRIEEGYLTLEELEKHLSFVQKCLPNVIIGIMADKNCKMDHIYNLMRVLRKAECLRVFYYTDKHKPQE